MDAVGDACDNCPNTANYDQTDSDNDATGDACETQPSGQICQRKTANFQKVDPNIFIVLDKSGSMAGPRMNEAKNALDQIAKDLWDEARFGLLAFDSGSCPGNFPVLLQMGSHSESTIKSSYSSVRGNGGTTLGHALEQVRRDKLYEDASDPLNSQRPKAVVAITDGYSYDQAACQPSDASRKMYNNNSVQTFAVGFSGGSSSQLNDIAREGGTDAGPNGAPYYYTANNSSQLVNVFRNISQNIISCSYKIQAPDANKIWVKVDGSYIAKSDYTYNANGQQVLQLNSQTCQTLRNSTASTPLEIEMGCATPCQPTGSETCNYKDDDCDGQVDEGCAGCVPEVCGDNKDNDCDGQTDEGCPPANQCQPSPEQCGDMKDNDCDGQTDEGCSTSMCTPSSETCDGKDNDCDGQTDEGCPPPTNCTPSPEVCGDMKDNDCDGKTDEGCTTNTCTPDPEICGDMKDNDCDGQTDEGCPPPGPSCTKSPEQCGDMKDNDCDGQVDEGCKPQCVPENEICDMTDNDCDGEVDEDCVKCPDGRSAEVCDGKDNDCDGEVDEGCPGEMCVVEGNEICDGIDNDCNGKVDDDCIECPNGRSPETCDGLDNDCDGQKDEGCPGA
jgi:uncharacterized protein YegL